MCRLNADRRLDGESSDAGSAEQAVRGEDHQVRRHPGSGRWIEAGDSEDRLHCFPGQKREKSDFFLKKAGFPLDKPHSRGIESIWGEKYNFGGTFVHPVCHSSISQNSLFRQVAKSNNVFRMFDLGLLRKDNNRRSV